MAERIGFIGLGLMGRPMAHHLLTAGYPLTVFNRSRPAIDELASAGARAAHSPREVAEQSDIVITMLPDGPDVEAVVTGTAGVREGVRKGMLFIDMSTISPLSREVRHALHHGWWKRRGFRTSATHLFRSGQNAHLLRSGRLWPDRESL